jgi:outer membrane protein assembly factor BamB
MRMLPIATLSCAMLCSAAANADDWPQWLGPHRDGASPEKIAPWKELKPSWKKPVGEGNSSPIVAGGVVYLHTKVKGKDAEKVQAFDAKSGDLKWEKTYDKAPFKPLFGEGPRSTPCVHEKRLFTLGNTGTLCCWNIADGELLWRHDTLKEFKEDNLFFGVSASPIVVGGKVLVLLGKGKTSVAAFDLDGKFAWKAGEDPGSYAAPISFGEGAKRQTVFLTEANVMSLSPSGEVLWKFPFVDALSESSTTPVKVDNIIIASSVKAGAVGLKLIDKDGKPDVEKVWKNPDLTCYFSTPVPAGKEHVFMVTGVASLTSASITLRCVDFNTGKETWKKPNVGKFHAALMKLGDGNLLMHTDSGELIMLAPDVKEYKELARSKICGGTWAHPALANGLLYVRDEKELICVGLNGQ